MLGDLKEKICLLAKGSITDLRHRADASSLNNSVLYLIRSLLCCEKT